MGVEIIDKAVIGYFKEQISTLDFVAKEHKTYVLRNIDVFLDKAQSRFQKAKVAGEIWKVVMFDSLKACTKNTRGFKELCEYIDKYIKYEDYLFAIDEEYRDHMIHSIWVMMVGIFLRGKCESFCDMDYSRNVLSLENKEMFTALIAEVRKYEVPLWFLVALTHDLGYPIEKTKSANQLMSEMINMFGFLKQIDFDYNFTVVHQGTIESLLRILSSMIFCDVTGGQKLYKVVNILGRDAEYAKSFEKLDHGIMSAYLLQRYIDWIVEEAVAVVGQEDIGFQSEEQVARIVVIYSLLKSITIHTSIYSYTHSMSDMACLLIICDELEEFSRYSRDAVTHEWKEIGVRTEIECNSELLEINYTFDRDIENVNVERFFKKKAKSIYNHFEVDEEGIKQLRIVCRDLTKAKEVVFIFEKKFEKSEINVWHHKGSKKVRRRDILTELVGYDSCSNVHYDRD